MAIPLLPLALMGGSAALGGLSGATAKRGRFKQLPTMTQPQIGRAEQAGQLGLHQLQNPYAGFDPIAQRAQSMFAQQTIPSLAERFTSLGQGALSSPAFASQLGEAGAGLSEALAALMADYGLKQQGLGQSLLGLGQMPQFKQAYMAGGPTFLSGLLGGASQGLGAYGSSGLQSHYLKNLLGSL